MSENPRVLVRARLDQALAYLRAAEPRVPLSRRALVTDVLIAALALAGSLLLVKNGDHGGVIITPAGVVAQSAQSLGHLWKHSAAAILLTSVPLAFRRRFPLTAFVVLLAGALATRQYATDVTFLAIVFAGYSAVAYSRFRNAAMLSMPLAGLLVVYAFWTAVPAISTVTHVSTGPLGLPRAAPTPPVAPIAPRAGGCCRDAAPGRRDTPSSSRALAAHRARGGGRAGPDRGCP